MYRYVKLSSTVYNAVVYLGNLSLIKTSRQEIAILFKNEKMIAAVTMTISLFIADFILPPDAEVAYKELPLLLVMLDGGGYEGQQMAFSSSDELEMNHSSIGRSTHKCDRKSCSVGRNHAKQSSWFRQKIHFVDVSKLRHPKLCMKTTLVGDDCKPLLIQVIVLKVIFLMVMHLLEEFCKQLGRVCVAGF